MDIIENFKRYQILGNNMHDHRGRKRRWDTMAI